MNKVEYRAAGWAEGGGVCVACVGGSVHQTMLLYELDGVQSSRVGGRGTPTKKRQVTKRQVSKRLVSKRSGFKTYETSGLQNVRFTKRQVFKKSGCKKTSISILYLLLVEIRRFCCSHVCRQSDGCDLFSILEGFAIYHHNC
jgi:hypothetical protein